MREFLEILHNNDYTSALGHLDPFIDDELPRDVAHGALRFNGCIGLSLHTDVLDRCIFERQLRVHPFQRRVLQLELSGATRAHESTASFRGGFLAYSCPRRRRPSPSRPGARLRASSLIDVSRRECVALRVATKFTCRSFIVVSMGQEPAVGALGWCAVVQRPHHGALRAILGSVRRRIAHGIRDDRELLWRCESRVARSPLRGLTGSGGFERNIAGDQLVAGMRGEPADRV